MPPNLSGLSHAFGSLVYRDFRKFAFSALLTSLGMQLFQTAVLWQVYEITGSALLLGLSGLARAGPHMILSLVGGVVAGRDYRTLQGLFRPAQHQTLMYRLRATLH